MKKLFFLLTFFSIAFMACQNSPSDAEEATITDASDAAAASDTAIPYAVDTKASVISWEGYKPGKYSHHGTIKLKDGVIKVKDGMPESGSFVIDINSLENEDLADTPDKKLKLETHLKSNDFFDVEKYPHGKFVMTGLSPLEGNAEANYTVSGNLIMKDITKGVEIPAQINMTDGTVTVTTSEFTINRTDWNVKFGSGMIGTIKDQLIADDVKLKINLVANKQVAEAQ